jgi:hypothetical protein
VIGSDIQKHLQTRHSFHPVLDRVRSHPDV